MLQNNSSAQTTRFPSNQWFCWAVQDQAGSSLLAYLSEELQSIPSKKFLKKALEKNICYVNGAIERFASRKLKKGDVVHFNRQWNELKSAREIPIIFEDETILVIDKPQDIASEDLEEIFPKTRLVHRLDKPTSGVMLLAKSGAAEKIIIEQFRKKLVKKAYLAIVHGLVKPSKDTIETYLEKKSHFAGQTIWGSTEKNGRHAITKYQKVIAMKEASLLLVRPITGKTHQIRVHLSEIDHPILGDAQYAKNIAMQPGHQLMLHSYQLEIKHPTTHKLIKFESKIPSRFSTLLKDFFSKDPKKDLLKSLLMSLKKH